MQHKKNIVYIILLLLSIITYSNVSGNFSYVGVSPTVMCEGNSGTLTFKVSSFFAGYSYYITGPGINPTTTTSIGSGTQQSIHIPLTNHVSAGTYQYKIEFFAPNNTVSLKTVNVAYPYLQAPVFISPIENAHGCIGSNISLTAKTIGTITSFQWERAAQNSSEWEVVSTSNVLNVVDINSSIENYSFRCKIKNKGCTESTSNNFIIRVGAPTIFNQPPQTIESCEKSVMELNVGASGENIAYQWEYQQSGSWIDVQESVQFQGVTSSKLKIIASLDLNNVAFRCKIASNCSDAISQPSIVTVIPNPINPIALFVPECTSGGNTTQRTLKITNPQAELGYNVLTPNYAVIHSYTHESGSEAILNITNLSPSDNRVIVYSFLPSGLGCTSENTVVSLLGSGNVLIGEQPESVTVCHLGSATFHVGNVTGLPLSGGMQYQWEFNTTPGTMFSNLSETLGVSGTQTPTLTYHAGYLSTSAATSIRLRCKVTGQCGSTYSNEAILTIREQININFTHSTIGSIPQGSTYTLNGNLYSTLPGVHYYFLSPDGNLKADYINTTSSVSVPIQIPNLDPGVTSLKIKASYESSPSCTEEGTITLGNNALPLILKHPEDVVVVSPGTTTTATFECLSEDPNATYSWWYSHNNQSPFVTLDIYTPILILNIESSAHPIGRNGYFYRCVVNNEDPTKRQTTRSAMLTVVTSNVNYQKPVSKTICNVGEVLTANIGDAVDGYTYQWQIFENSSWNNMEDNDLYSGMTSTKITILNPLDDKIYRVRCKIVANSSTITTESVDLKRVSPPTQINKGSEILLCSPIAGKPASLSLSVTSKAYQQYLWNTGEKTSSIVVRENGNHSVIVSTEGCSTTLEIDIDDFPQDNLNLDIQGPSNLDCRPESLEEQEFTVPEGFETYHWHSPTTPATSTVNNYAIFINELTNITATITDSKKCSISRTHQVSPSTNRSPNVEYLRRCVGTPTLVQGSSRNEVTQWLWYDSEGNIISQGKSFVYISEAGNYTLKVLYADGCVGTKQFTVDFEISNTTIANKNALKEIFFCELASVTLSTTIPHSTYSWMGPNGFLGSTPTLSVGEEGKYYVITTDEGKACPGIDTVYIHKYPAPPVEITASNQKICTSDVGVFKPNKRLDAPSGYTSYLWSTGETGLSIEVDRIGNHEYTLTVEDDNGCFNTVTYPVNIDNVGIYNKENTTCANGELAIEGTEGAYNYHWEWSLNGVSQTLDHPNSRVQLFNVTAPSILTLKITDQSNENCFITDIANVQVGESPKVSITATPGNTICRGNTVTLTGNIIGEVNNIEWVYNEEIVAQSESTTVDKPGTYKIIVENSTTGCKASEIQKITLQELPKVVILPYQKVCLGHTTTLKATVPGEIETDYTYVWQDTSNNAIYNVKTPGNYTVKVKHNLTGCENQQSVVVDFLSIPPPTVIGHKSFAATTLFTVGVLEDYSSYLWCNDNIEKSIILPHNSTCNVTVVDFNGCISSTDFTTNNNITTLNITASSQNVCYGTPVELILEEGFHSYQWYVNGRLLPYTSSNKIVLKNVGDYQIYAVVEDSYGNSITTTSLDVTIKPAPDVSIQGIRTFCDAMPAQYFLKSSNTTLAAYEWLKDGSSIASDPNNPYQITLINSPAIAGLYTLKATAINGCTTEVSDTLTLRKSKAYVIAPTVACTGDTITLKASPGYEQYIWQEGGIDVATDLYYKAFRTGRYSAKIQDKYGCNFQTPAHSILFSQNVKFEIIGSNIVCEGDSVELKVSEIFAEYLWSTGETTPSIYVKEQNTYTITAFNSSTCSSTKEIIVYKRPKYNVVVRDTACLGSPYQFGTLSITEPGIYQHQFSSQEGCDSIVTLSLVFTDPPEPITIALNEKGILNLIDFNQKGLIEWFAEDQLMLRANDTQYEPLRNGRFYARFVKHGSCAVKSNEINVNIYSSLDVGIQKTLIEKDRKAPYYFNDVIPYQITVINETENVVGNNIVLQIIDFFDKNIFSLPTNYEENKNWKIEGNDDNYTRISQSITIPEFNPKDSIHLVIYLKAVSGGTLFNNAEVTLQQDNGRFAKEYYDYLYNNKSEIDCKVRFSVSQLPLRYVVTTNGSPENRCVVIRPENQFTTEFYRIQVFLYNRMGQQVYSHQNFENKELCSEDFPAGTFIFVMKFTELETMRESSLSGTITNVK